MNKCMKASNSNDSGFTLVELLIAMAISSIVATGIYNVLTAQNKAYTTQSTVVDIQQDLRAGMYYLTREARMAGYEQKGSNQVAGIIRAGSGAFRFTMDIFNGFDDDGDTFVDDADEVGINDGILSASGEDIIYSLVDDAGFDGLPDTLTALGTPKPDTLSRTDVFGLNIPEAVMNNVEAIAFAYAFDNDNDGLVDRSGGNIIWAVDADADGWLDTTVDTNSDGAVDINDTVGGAALATTSPVHVDAIRMVRIWLLVRSPSQDGKVSDNQTCIVGMNHLAVNDHYRRRLLTASVMCRNMGE